MKDILIVSVSPKDNIGDVLLSPPDVPVSFIGNNTASLPSVYNQFLTEEFANHIIVFVHDDVYIADKDFETKCRAACDRYDVFGVAGGAGSISIHSSKPALWHLITENRVGFAGHFAEGELDIQNPYNNTCWVTTFGHSPQKATLIDGVLLGVNVDKVLQSGVKFDEDCPAKFHFYDLLFCVRAKKAGLSLGVFPFNIFHASHGLTSPTEEFYKGDEYFKQVCKATRQIPKT